MLKQWDSKAKLMTEEILHLTFSPYGGTTLQTVLKKAGRSDEVIALRDCLAFGPIDHPDNLERADWVQREFGAEDSYRVIEVSRSFWNNVLSDRRHKVLWTSRRCAQDYSGFLECLRRLDHTPCSVVDLTDTRVIGRSGKSGLAICLSMLHEDVILEQGILDLAEPLKLDDRKFYHDVWKNLRKENAPFRVVGINGITSAPITYFDNLIFSCALDEWQKSARVIGKALAKDMDDEYYQTGDLVLFARLRKLVERGVLEGRGDMSEMRTSEVRRPTS